MGLSVHQQARAALAYIVQQIRASSKDAKILADDDFMQRLQTNFITIFAIFVELYGYRNDCLDQIVDLIKEAGRSWLDRSPKLKVLDRKRELDKEWFLSNKMLGGVCYVDKYAGNLEGIRAAIPYFKELGLTYLHLMPLFKAPKPFSDGGYAITSYREVEPELGTMEQLESLASDLREAGISLVIDLVFNHTSNDHEWAKRAAAGDPHYSAYYWIFPDRHIPSMFERSTREIFPDDHPGSFVQLPDGRWIWSTFYHFQWDLNYSNPSVFRAMAGEMLYLANVGIDVFRMDAVAFMWKEMNTDCENRPEAHKILRAFNALCRIAAPSVLFKSEAIVHPDAVAQYIDSYECQLSYNPLQMALTWEALATRDASLLSQAIERRHNLPRGCAWINYVRSHDDIGWTFSNEDALELGKNGHDHRRFLNAFYVNRHPGSFARGEPFQDNPKTGDCRISGTTASLAGLEVESGEDAAIERILLAYSVAMSLGGISLIYLGDEVGQLNDYSYVDDPARRDDTRWVNRPPRPDHLYALRLDKATVPGRIYDGFRALIHARKTTDAIAGGRAHGFYTGNPAVLGYLRPGHVSAYPSSTISPVAASSSTSPLSSVLCLANFSDQAQWVDSSRFGALPAEGLDVVTGVVVPMSGAGIQLRPRQFLWLKYPFSMDEDAKSVGRRWRELEELRELEAEELPVRKRNVGREGKGKMTAVAAEKRAEKSGVNGEKRVEENADGKTETGGKLGSTEEKIEGMVEGKAVKLALRN